MKKLFNKKFTSLVLLVLTLTSVIALTVFADQLDPNSLNGYVKTLTNQIRAFAVVFIALSAVITAILYMSGSVNPKLKDKAKDALFALIIGVIVLVLSGNIASWVQDITKKEIKNNGEVRDKASITIDYNQYV